MSKKFARITVSGLVQGVGYRYLVLRIAKQQGVVGTVCNLADGRVEVQAEGSEAQLHNFIDEIKVRDGLVAVDDVKVEMGPCENRFSSFEIVMSGFA